MNGYSGISNLAAEITHLPIHWLARKTLENPSNIENGADTLRIPSPPGSRKTSEKMTPLNVLGTPLVACSFDPITGYFRDGCCNTNVQDPGTHVVCAQVTAEFLDFSLSRGNDLMTPRPESRFAGLKPGDKWCLCALRWREALEAGVAPPVQLEATHAKALEIIALKQLQMRAL
jgi:uncharacterized protein (DUF2237 family)